MTHRGLSRRFAVLTARPSEAWHATVDALPPKTLTLVFMMALAARKEIAERLLARAWPDDTPRAVVLGAHTERMWQWTGPLSALSSLVLPEADRADLPGLVVVGDVVAVGERLTRAIAAHKLEAHIAIA